MIRPTRVRRWTALVTALVMLMTMAVPVAIAKGPKAPVPRNPVNVQILGLNDFHGQLEAVRTDDDIRRTHRLADGGTVRRPDVLRRGGRRVSREPRRCPAVPESEQHRVRLGW